MTRALILGKQGLAASAVVGLLGGCVSSHGGLTRETMASCISEAGITGGYSASSSLRNDRMTFIVRPGPNVTEAQAEIANACIVRTIDGGPSGEPVPASVAGPSCERGGGVFQGGTGYCAR